MHIEDIERDNLKTLSDKDLFSVRLRFIQVWNKNFRKSIGIPLVGGLSRSEILDRYELVAKEVYQSKEEAQSICRCSTRQWLG